MTAPSLHNPPPTAVAFASRKDYESQLEGLQEQLLGIQLALARSGERAIIVFEGVDASGKGGAIRRITRLMDPRGYRVHAVSAPSAEEQSRHYLWRFFRRLPPAGRIAIFDRSWYGRVLVERVEQLASEAAWQRAYREINELERWLTDDGVRLCKFYLSIDKDEQARRFEARLRDPMKSWKFTEEDLRNRRQWDAYFTATNEMFAATHTDHAPWELIEAGDKRSARVAILGKLAAQLGANLAVTPPRPKPDLLAAAAEELGVALGEGPSQLENLNE